MEEKINVPNYLGRKIKDKLQSEYGIETDGVNFTKKELDLVKELEVVPPREGRAYRY